MNERIRQLAEQVGAVRNVLAMGRHDGVLFTESELEKLAELIVRECYGEVLCQLYDYYPSSNEQYNAGHEAGLKLAVSKIKQHFGVK